MDFRERASRLLFNIPHPRQFWENGVFVQKHEKNEEAWVEQFIDLVYVVLLSKLALIFETCEFSSSLFFRVLVLFWSMCLTRHAFDEYSNRFYSHDLTHKATYLLYTVAIFVQVLNLNAHETDGAAIAHPYSSSSYKNGGTAIAHSLQSCGFVGVYAMGFNVGFLLTRVSVILMYAVVMIHNDAAKHQFTMNILRWSVSCVVMVISMTLNAQGLMSQNLDTGILGIICCLEMAGWIYNRTLLRHRFVFPMDLDLMQSRWGDWVLIVIGEGIIQMLHVEMSETHLKSTYLAMLLALGLIFSLSMQYFDGCRREWYEHAITNSALAGVSWIWLHPVLSASFFFLGVTMKEILQSASKSGFVPRDTIILASVCAGAVSLTVTLIRMTHFKSYHFTREKTLLLGIRLMGSCLQVSVLAWGIENAVTFIAVQMILSMAVLNTADFCFDFIMLGEMEARNLLDESGKTKLTKPRPWFKIGLLQGSLLVPSSSSDCLVAQDGRPSSSTRCDDVPEDKDEDDDRDETDVVSVADDLTTPASSSKSLPAKWRRSTRGGRAMISEPSENAASNTPFPDEGETWDDQSELDMAPSPIGFSLKVSEKKPWTRSTKGGGRVAPFRPSEEGGGGGGAADIFTVDEGENGDDQKDIETIPLTRVPSSIALWTEESDLQGAGRSEGQGNTNDVEAPVDVHAEASTTPGKDRSRGIGQTWFC